MRVLVVSHLYPSPGVERHLFVHEQLLALRELGVESHVISPTPWVPRVLWRDERQRRRGEKPRQAIRDGITAETYADRLLALTHDAPDNGHVFTLHAELEGMKLLPEFERLLAGWKEQGYELVACRQMVDALDRDMLPRCQVTRGEVPGRAGQLMQQGPEFLMG